MRAPIVVSLAFTILVAGGLAGAARCLQQEKAEGGRQAAHAAPAHSRISPPAKGQHLRVAFVVSEDAVMIDFTGPWEIRLKPDPA